MINAAAASAPSTPTPNVAAATAGSRSDRTGIACTKTGTPNREASAKKSANRGSPSDTPPTLEAISTPARPSSLTPASSAAASAGSCIGTVPSPKNRRGSTAHRDTMNSLIHRHRSRPAGPGTA